MLTELQQANLALRATEREDYNEFLYIQSTHISETRKWFRERIEELSAKANRVMFTGYYPLYARSYLQPKLYRSNRVPHECGHWAAHSRETGYYCVECGKASKTVTCSAKVCDWSTDTYYTLYQDYKVRTKILLLNTIGA